MQKSNDMTTNTNIIRIGNSLGIILPAKMLKKLEAKERDILKLEEMSGRIVLSNPVKESCDPFAAISAGGWYGKTRQETDDLAAYLHDSRINTREIDMP